MRAIVSERGSIRLQHAGSAVVLGSWSARRQRASSVLGLACRIHRDRPVEHQPVHGLGNLDSAVPDLHLHILSGQHRLPAAAFFCLHRLERLLLRLAKWRRFHTHETSVRGSLSPRGQRGGRGELAPFFPGWRLGLSLEKSQRGRVSADMRSAHMRRVSAHARAVRRGPEIARSAAHLARHRRGKGEGVVSDSASVHAEQRALPFACVRHQRVVAPFLSYAAFVHALRPWIAVARGLAIGLCQPGCPGSHHLSPTRLRAGQPAVPGILPLAVQVTRQGEGERSNCF